MKSMVKGILLFLVAVVPLSAASPPPNILWITAEDLSPDLGCYGDAYARTPHLDALAREGVRYTRAFATASVCAPARSCLITGMYATSLGTQRLRSEFPVPKEIRGFAALLREAGYYTANNVKTDYNMKDERAFIRDSWDDCSVKAHWRGRRPGQPFFAVFNIMTTHQSRLSVWSHAQFEKEVGSKLASNERHDPARAPIPPFYPDTAESRRLWARYHDCITVMDKEVGAILDQLAADGLADSTIVFFFGDNGMGMPRGKRCLWDTGLRVPLLIRFPEKFRHLAPVGPGGTTDRLVSFVDFAPTILSIAGVKPPSYTQGVAFLGHAAGKPRQFVFGARDRVDEAFELSRSVRDARYLYIRNYFPHLSWMQPESFSDGTFWTIEQQEAASPFRRELKRLAAEGKLNAAQLGFAGQRKPLEELYDTDADPHQINNLAGSPAHKATLKKMQRILQAWMLDTRDAGFLTEPQIWERLGDKGTVLELARDNAKYPLSRLLEAADLVGRPEAVRKQSKLLDDADDGVRYWAAVGLHAAGPQATTTRTALLKALKDKSAVVRIEAAATLVELDGNSDALAVLENELRSSRWDVVLHAARALELLGERARPALPAMREVYEAACKNMAAGSTVEFVRCCLNSALRGHGLQP